MATPHAFQCSDRIVTIPAFPGRVDYVDGYQFDGSKGPALVLHLGGGESVTVPSKGHPKYRTIKVSALDENAKAAPELRAFVSVPEARDLTVVLGCTYKAAK